MYRVGINLGEKDIKIGIVAKDYTIVFQDTYLTDGNSSYQDTIKLMAELIQDSIKIAQIYADDIAGIGIGCPGAIDDQEGTVVFSKQLNWENVPLVKELHKYMNYPIAISNDANCVALGEVKAGSAKDCENIVLLTFRIGVGGGIISNGKIFAGGHAGGAELGHTMLVRGGEVCECGRKGCLEAYASVAALIRQAKEAVREHPESLLWKYCGQDLDQLQMEPFFMALKEKDQIATEVWNEYISYLGDGIVDFVNIFRPDKVLLSEGPCCEGTSLTDPLNAYLKKYCFAGGKSMIPTIVCTTLGEKAGIIGAAELTR